MLKEFSIALFHYHFHQSKTPPPYQRKTYSKIDRCQRRNNRTRLKLLVNSSHHAKYGYTGRKIPSKNCGRNPRQLRIN